MKAELCYDYITTNGGKHFVIYDDAVGEDGTVNPTTYYDTDEVAYK